MSRTHSPRADAAWIRRVIADMRAHQPNRSERIKRLRADLDAAARPELRELIERRLAELETL
jgi:hypothetical protein